MQFKSIVCLLTISSFVILFLGCDKEAIEEFEESRDIYFVEFNNETAYFKDTTFSYDFNND